MADNVNIIVQDTINDIVVNAAVVVETIDINVQAAVDVVDIVANPNNYVVNINRIIGEQVQSDWTQTDNQAPDYIKNKPTIPTATSDLTNDGEDGINPFITAADVTAQVNSDWNATTGVAEILNKPAIPTNTSDLTNDGEDGVNPFITLADVPVPTNGLPAGGTAGQILTKVDATDYNATWQENFADWTSQVKHIVKNNGLSGTITKGTAVYVTSSNGTNMLVGRASNASEPTSSKTMGLMQSDITTTGGNQTGFVITEGLLEGLNTASATAGDPVWLGVNGALIYGLTNKPYAPAHLVFIGIVTKVSAGNGEIFVKVQNGFELKEIHDVDLITTTPINGHLLGFDGTLWVNKTIASWLGYTPVTDARTISTTAPLSGGGDLTANRTLSITQATTSTNGYLSSTDWNTFNNKFTLPSFTSGSVLFSNGSTIAQDNANLFWDDTNNRLGIGTASPDSRFYIAAQGALSTDLVFKIRNSANTADILKVNGLGIMEMTNVSTSLQLLNTTGLGVQFQNGAGSTSYSIRGWNVNSGAYTPLNINASTLNLNTLSNTNVIFGGGNVLINTTTDAGYKLDVNGTARVSGVLTTTADAVINGANIGLGGGNVSSNVRFGSSAGQSNTTGSANCFIGASAGQSNTTASNNLFFGSSAGALNSTGAENSFFGVASGLNNTTGSNNLFLGRNAGRHIANGSTANSISNNSIFLGNASKANASGESNQIVIGDSAIGAGSNTATLGNTSILDTILRGRINLQQYATGSRPTYVKGALIYDSTLGKLVVGGATAWEVVTSV